MLCLSENILANIKKKNCHGMGPFIVSQSMWGRRTTPSRGGGAMLPKKISLLWENFINLGVFHRVIYDRIRN